jgi:hypothetical protein
MKLRQFQVWDMEILLSLHVVHAEFFPEFRAEEQKVMLRSKTSLIGDAPGSSPCLGIRTLDWNLGGFSQLL